MAGNKGFGARVKLAVDTSNKKEFNEQVRSFAKNTEFPVKPTVSKENVKRLAESLQTKLNNHTFEIKIEKFDTSKAEKDLKKRLQGMIDALSLENKVKISGLKDPTGEAKELASQMQDAAQKAKGLEAATAKVNSQLKMLKELEKNLTTSYNKAFKSGAARDDLDVITSQYAQLVEKLNIARETRSVGDFEDLQREALGLQNSIDLLLKKVSAHKEVERAARRASKAQEREQQKANKAVDDSTTLLKRQVALHKEIERYLTANTRAKGRKEYSAIENIFAQTSSTKNLNSEKLDGFIKDFARLKLEISNVGLEGRSFTDTLARMYEKFGGWALITKSFGMVIRASKQVYHNVVELDTAMTELKKVTDETNATYERFFEGSISRAKELGATVSDIILATADYARLGYDIQEASALADASIIYKNVADGLTNINEASESIISTMQAFGIEASRAMEIVDRFNEVGRLNCPAA